MLYLLDNRFPIKAFDLISSQYELDSLPAFLEVSNDYWNATHDLAFFAKYNWVNTVLQILNTAEAMMTPTYAAHGSVNPSPYSFTRLTTRQTETMANNGLGSPVQNDTGLIRSAFRPSDDSTLFQFLVPANAMFARYLASCATIMQSLSTSNGKNGFAQPALAAELTTRMATMATSLRAAIAAHGTYVDPVYDEIYGYEVDGYGSVNSMDDANIPSLLSLPLLGYLDITDPVYLATRDKILSGHNPYFMRGPVLSAVGGPHDGYVLTVYC